MSISGGVAASFAVSFSVRGGFARALLAAGFAGAACPGVACGASVGGVLDAGACASAGVAAHNGRRPRL